MKKLLIDTNILILFLVGTYRLDLIGVHRNCREFDLTDFDLLAGLIASYDQLLYLPNTLTETSNLIRQTREPDKSRLTEHITSLFRCGIERYVQSDVAAQSAGFARLGLTDCALLSADLDAVLLTKDLDLYWKASSAGREVINFLHYRESVAPRV